MQREDFYRKELSFQVSCSYGPGRYDPVYEDQGRDYPLAFVRWTQQRNFEAVLDLMAAGKLDVSPLITHRFPLTDAAAAYEIIGGKEPSLGVLLQSPQNDLDDLRRETIRFPETSESTAGSKSPLSGKPVTLGVIGAGGFASKVLLPAFRAAGCRLHTVASRGGVSAVHAARKFGFQQATTDLNRIFDDVDINTIVIATRHDTHAELSCRALAAGKHVFVEKPLALNETQLGRIVEAHRSSQRSPNPPALMVGFNRRFAPQVQQMAKLLRGISEPKTFLMTVNAGAIPADHWTRHPEIGGGRMIGEGCHFLDLLRFLAGHPATDVQATLIGRQAAIRDDKVTCTLSFSDGSFGTIHYLANGHRSFPKERLEVFCGGRILQLDNFRKLTGYGWPNFRRMNLWRQDKGHRPEAVAFCRAIQTGEPSPIPFAELVEVTQLSFVVVGRSHQPAALPQFRAGMRRNHGKHSAGMARNPRRHWEPRKTRNSRKKTKKLWLLFFVPSFVVKEISLELQSR